MFSLAYVFREVSDCPNVQGFIATQFSSGFFNDDHAIVVVTGSDGIPDDLVQCDGIHSLILVLCCHITKARADRGLLKQYKKHNVFNLCRYMFFWLFFYTDRINLLF